VLNAVGLDMADMTIDTIENNCDISTGRPWSMRIDAFKEIVDRPGKCPAFHY